LQFTGLLQGTQRSRQRTKQGKQDQGAVLVEMELTIAGLVASTTVIVQPFQELQQPAKVFPPFEVVFAQRLGWSVLHPPSMR